MREADTKPRTTGVGPTELIVALAITGILATITIPSFLRYIHRAKTSEAMASLDRIVVGAKSYFRTEHVDSGWLIRRFPASVGSTPAIPCWLQPDDKCRGSHAGWTNPSWRALRFSMDHDHHYTYEFRSAGADTSATFTALARGNLDGDDVTSTWKRTGTVDSQYEVVPDSLIIEPSMEIE